jgi:2-(1,2-epoxy-1,2-dihydrophenyl)acetyl-CoA isomerase
MNERMHANDQPEPGAAAVLREVEGGVHLFRLNQPRVRNAMTPEIKAGLAAGVDAFLADPEARCLVLTGSGGVFCAGGDLRSMTDRRPLATRRRLQAGHRWVRALAASDKIVIAAVNGAAVGAGFSLALLADIVIASEDAYFLGGFPAVGVTPDYGLLYTLPRAIGMTRAKDLLLTNRRVAAPEALALGLVSRVFPAAELIPAALAMARGIAAGPAVALGFAKQLMDTAHEMSFDAFLDKEALAQATTFGTEDFAEGVAAFLAKRKPRFTGG